MLGKEYLFTDLHNIISHLFPRILVVVCLFFLIITNKANVPIYRMKYFFPPISSKCFIFLCHLGIIS